MNDEDFDTGPVAPVMTSLEKLSRDTRQDPANKTKAGLLQILDNSFSDYSDIDLSEQEAAKLQIVLKRLSTGSSSFILLHCRGSSCPFASRCPLVQMGKTPENSHGKAPVGKDCILESSLLRDATSSYFQEYQVDPAYYTEVNIVTELAEIEVLLWRINMQLGKEENSLLVIDQTIGFDRTTGQPIVQQQVAPLFEQKQKLATRKSKLIKVMVGDRQEKYKKEAALKQKPTTDASSQMSKLKEQLQQLQNKLNVPGVIDGEIVSPEDFILQEQEK